MYSYFDEQSYEIENVDHEIDILGVKLGYLPYLIWVFLLGLVAAGPLVGVILVALSIGVCRMFYKAEQRGEPITLKKEFLDLLSHPRAKAAARFFPHICSLEVARNQYRQ